MVKPTSTAHALRAIFRDLKSDAVINGNGMLETEIPFPSIKCNRNFAAEYFLYNVARKREPNKGTYDSNVAIRNSLRKWSDSEHTCRVVNLHGRYFSPLGTDKPLFDFLQQKVRAKISSILCDYWPDLGSFQVTGGATSEARRGYCHPAVKVSGMPDSRQKDHNLACVPGARDLLIETLSENPAITYNLVRRRWKLTDDTPICTVDDVLSTAEWLVQANVPARMDFVPKNTEEVRLIVKTGGMTASIQKMFGDCIRKALLAEGVNLNDQTTNQEWAEIGSLTGLVATVDLSSASDNIAMRLMSYFPARWQEYVHYLRDREVSAGGSTHVLQKIAGMGNGFIFELESLLFYAIAFVVTDHLNGETSWVSVYGDDIIIPSMAAPLLERFFLFHGFTYNSTKSFAGLEGFRESCGKHYYRGEDVTPFYFRGDAESISDHYHIVNGLTEWSNRTKIPLVNSIALIVNCIPAKHRTMIPLNYPSRSGLYWPCDKAVYPVSRYDKNLQRTTISYKVYNETIIDELPKWPSDVQKNAMLMALNEPDIVIDFRQLVTGKNVLNALLFRDLDPLYEFVTARIDYTPTVYEGKPFEHSTIRKHCTVWT